MKPFQLPRVLGRLAYPLYERRLARSLAGLPRPQHVAVMADGNRRWAREAGFTDVSHGHRVGARKIAEFVSWCSEQDIGLVTIYLLSTENLRREADELELLFDIIGDVATSSPARARTSACGWWGTWSCFPTTWRPACAATRS